MKRTFGIIIAIAVLSVCALATTVFADNSGKGNVVVKDGNNNIKIEEYYSQLSYKATKSGMLTLTFKEIPSSMTDPGPITLQDNKGHSVSEITYPVKSTSKGKDVWKYVWSVRKGNTYICYLWYHSSIVRDYSLNLSTKTIPNNNISKKKATKLKLKKAKTGMVANGQSQASWFKIKFKKARKGTFIIKGKDITGNLSVIFYKGKKKITETRISKGSSVKLYSAAFTGSIKKKMRKGTYYIKVKRWTQISGGDFSIKVK